MRVDGIDVCNRLRPDVGMDAVEAEAMTKKVFVLMHYSKDVERFRAGMTQDTAFLHQKKFVDRLLEYLEVELHTQSTPEQMAILTTAVTERVGGIITNDDFAERLTLPPALGGAAYGEKNAALLARYLEKLIAQGGYVIRPNELLGAHS